MQHELEVERESSEEEEGQRRFNRKKRKLDAHTHTYRSPGDETLVNCHTRRQISRRHGIRIPALQIAHEFRHHVCLAILVGDACHVAAVGNKYQNEKKRGTTPEDKEEKKSAERKTRD